MYKHPLDEYPDYDGPDRFVITIVVVCLIAVVCVIAIPGCASPHRKSAAEIHHDKVVAAKEQAYERRKAADERRLKRAQERARIAAMPSSPPGIEQMDSTHFFVHKGFEGNTRDLCRTSQDNSPAGIAAIDPAPNSDDMIITCNNAEHEYRHAPITKTPVHTASGG